MIKCNFGMAFFNSIVRNGGKELNEYNALSRERKIEVISKFWSSLVRFVFLNKLNVTYWREADAKEREIAKQYFSTIPDAIVLKGRKQEDEAFLALTVSYNEELCSAEITPYVVAKDKATEELLAGKIGHILIALEKYLARKLTKEMAIKHCYEALYGQGLCSVRGDDAVTMYRIMRKAIYHYPKFAELDDCNKRDILRKGYYRGMQVSARERDMFSFARATFEVFFVHGLANVVYKFDPNLNKYKTYERCGQSPYCIPSSVCPRFIMYKFGTSIGVDIKTSFLPFDLWELLARQELASAPV